MLSSTHHGITFITLRSSSTTTTTTDSIMSYSRTRPSTPSPPTPRLPTRSLSPRPRSRRATHTTYTRMHARCYIRLAGALHSGRRPSPASRGPSGCRRTILASASAEAMPSSQRPPSPRRPSCYIMLLFQRLPHPISHCCVTSSALPNTPPSIGRLREPPQHACALLVFPS